jgi:hypothetical protein
MLAGMLAYIDTHLHRSQIHTYIQAYMHTMILTHIHTSHKYILPHMHAYIHTYVHCGGPWLRLGCALSDSIPASRFCTLQETVLRHAKRTGPRMIRTRIRVRRADSVMDDEACAATVGVSDPQYQYLSSWVCRGAG